MKTILIISLLIAVTVARSTYQQDFARFLDNFMKARGEGDTSGTCDVEGDVSCNGGCFADAGCVCCEQGCYPAGSACCEGGACTSGVCCGEGCCDAGATCTDGACVEEKRSRPSKRDGTPLKSRKGYN